jgi:hypothetical protein
MHHFRSCYLLITCARFTIVQYWQWTVRVCYFELFIHQSSKSTSTLPMYLFACVDAYDTGMRPHSMLKKCATSRDPVYRKPTHTGGKISLCAHKHTHASSVTSMSSMLYILVRYKHARLSSHLSVSIRLTWTISSFRSSSCGTTSCLISFLSI